MLVFIISSCTSKPQEEVIERWNNKTPKVVHQYINKSDSTFKQLEYYESGMLRMENNYLKSVLHGTQSGFHESGIKGAEYNYNHGVRHGYFGTWYESGILKSEYLISEGLVTSGGNYYDNGQLIGSLTFVNGQIVFGIYYHKNGKLRSEQTSKLYGMNFSRETLMIIFS